MIEIFCFWYNQDHLDITSILHIIYTNYKSSSWKIAHSVCAGPSSSRPTCPFLFFPLHVAFALAVHWLIIFTASWGAGSSLTPFPQADPIFLRSLAMPHSNVGHNYILRIVDWSAGFYFPSTIYSDLVASLLHKQRSMLPSLFQRTWTSTCTKCVNMNLLMRSSCTWTWNMTMNMTMNMIMNVNMWIYINLYTTYMCQMGRVWASRPAEESRRSVKKRMNNNIDVDMWDRVYVR